MSRRAKEAIILALVLVYLVGAAWADVWMDQAYVYVPVPGGTTIEVTVWPPSRYGTLELLVWRRLPNGIGRELARVAIPKRVVAIGLLISSLVLVAGGTLLRRMR